MKMPEFSRNLPRTFISFRKLEKGTQLYEEEQTGKNQQELMFSPGMCSRFC